MKTVIRIVVLAGALAAGLMAAHQKMVAFDGGAPMPACSPETCVQ
jgi:hypothetical protein